MSDAINPNHYQLPTGAQLIDLTEQMNFCRGNAMKYLFRAGRKDPSKELEDLEKARWYIDREIARVKAIQPTAATGPTMVDTPFPQDPADAKLVTTVNTLKGLDALEAAFPGSTTWAVPPTLTGECGGHRCTGRCGVDPTTEVCLWVQAPIPSPE